MDSRVCVLNLLCGHVAPRCDKDFQFTMGLVECFRGSPAHWVQVGMMIVGLGWILIWER